MADARLEVTDEQGYRVVVLDKPTFTIGRRGASDLHLTGGDVSRQHAEILTSHGHYLLHACGSRGGTYVNGTQVTEQRLSHGDKIQVGQGAGARLVFLTHDRPPDTGSRTPTDASAIVGGFRQIATLLDALRGLGGHRVLDEVLTLVMDAAIDFTNAERGFLMLAGARGQLEPKVARMRGPLPLATHRCVISRKIPEHLFATAEAAVIRDLMDEPRHPGHDRTIAHGIRQVLCVPLLLVSYVDNPNAPVETQPIGVLYLDSREKARFCRRPRKMPRRRFAPRAAARSKNRGPSV